MNDDKTIHEGNKTEPVKPNPAIAAAVVGEKPEKTEVKKEQKKANN
jgi:hypothetical protein